MAINTLEAGVADETAVDNTNILVGLTSGYTMVRSLAGTGTARYDTATPHRANLAVRLDAPATTDIARLDVTGLNATSAVLEPYIRLSAYPAAEAALLQLRTPSVAVAALAITSTGQCRLYDAAGTAVWLSASPVPLNQYVRYSLGALIGSATVSPFNGALRFEYFAGAQLEGSTATETASTFFGGTSPSAANTGVANITQLRVGKLGTAIGWSGIQVDDIQFNPASYALMGGVTGALPVNAWTLKYFAQIDPTATTGTLTGQTLVQQSGPSLTITGPDANGRFWAELPNPMTSPGLVRLTSTSSAGSDADDIPISPLGGTTTTYVRDELYYDGSTLV